MPGHDVVALFAKDDKCAVSFSGTHGLADWSTNFNAMLGRSGTISVEVTLFVVCAVNSLAVEEINQEKILIKMK